MPIDPIILDGYLLVFIHQHVQIFCALCHNLLQEPVQFVHTGHRFCMCCIYQPPNTISLHPGLCELCLTDGIPLELNCARIASRTATRELFSMIFHDRGVVRDINKLQAWCTVCGNTLLYEDKMAHRHN